MAGINLGPDHDLAIRLTDMESQIAALSTRDVLQNASIGKNGLTVNNGGGITIVGGGSLTIGPGGMLNVASGGLNSAGSISAVTTVTAGTTITAGGNIYTPATVQGDAGITSAGVYNLDVSTLPGTRRTDWVNQNGQIGYAPSSITKKNLIGPVTITPADFLACAPVVFEYLGQIDIRDNPDNPNYDPDYIVVRELGHIAEVLVENNCGAFVFTHEDGSPAGINYGEFAAVGFVIVGRDHEARIADLEASRKHL